MLRRLLPVLVVLALCLSALAFPKTAETQQFDSTQQAAEIIELRGETSKTYDLGDGTYRLVIGGSVHWKYDYQNDTELWKEVDLTWEELPGGRRQITQAPYILVQNGKHITFTDRKTGKTSTLELLSVIPKVPYEIIPFAEGVSFQHSIPNLKVPFEAKFRVTGNPWLSTRAFDDGGELELQTTFEGDILTERLSKVKDGISGQERKAQGQIRIDPTLTIQPNVANAYITTWYGGNNNYGNSYIWVFLDSSHRNRGLLTFSQSSLPPGATIISGIVSLYYYSYSVHSNPSGRTYRFHRLRREDWVEMQATYNIYKTANSWGTAGAFHTTTDIDTTFSASTTVPSVVNRWMNWTVTTFCEDAQANRSNQLHLLLFDASAVSGQRGALFYGRSHATTSVRPKLTIEYLLGPTVDSLAATEVRGTSAVAHGEVLTVGGDSVTERGFVWDTVSRGNPGNVHPSASDYSDYWTEEGSWGVGTFDHTLGGLEVDEVYYFRAAAKSDTLVWGYGEELEFLTAPPTVVTLAATNVKDSSASLWGRIDAVNDISITEWGFDWGRHSGVYTQGWTHASIRGEGVFGATLDGLSSGITLYYRAKAKGQGGAWGYGAEMTFSTYNPSLYAYYSTGDDAEVDVYGPNWYAQTFTPWESFSVEYVRIKAGLEGDPGPVTVSIRNVNDLGQPRTVDLVSASYNGMGAAVDWYEIQVPEYPLVGGTQYALVVRAVAGDAANYVEWRYDSAGNYTGGCYAFSTNSGTTWTLNTTNDFMFEIRGHSLLKILDAKVYTGYMEEGDWLIVVQYFNEYPPYYGEAVMADYFALQLVVGGEAVTSTRLRQWGRMPAAIYLSREFAETLDWGSTYQVRMIGLFDPYPAASYTLIPPDWIGSDLLKLDSWVLTTAKAIGNYYETAMTVISGTTEVLNEVGGALFKIGIPLLDKIRPHLFYYRETDVPYSEKDYKREYADSFDYTELLGDKITEDAASLGGLAGLAALQALQLGFFSVWLIAVIGVAAVAGSAALLVSIPFLLGGSLSGILPIAPIAVIAAIFVLVLVYVVWIRGS